MKLKSKPKSQSGGLNVRFPSGLKGVKRPVFADNLKFPDDITALSAANVSDLLGKYTQMYAYANQELALINVRILELQTMESRRSTEIFCSNPSLNQQERWRRDAVLDTDKKIQDCQYEIALKKQERELVQMFLLNYDKYLTALSRELSRKTHEQDLGRRN